MADERLTDRTTLSELADGDLIHVVDISDTTDNPLGTSKKGLWSLFKSTLLTYFNTQYLRSVTGDSVDNTDPLNPVVNAIPLSGTEVGSPVTGDVQFQNDTKLILNDVGGDIGFIQGRSDGIIEIGSDAYPVLISGDAGLNVTKVIQAEGGIQGDGTGNELRITGNDTGRGLIGIEYYGANYDNNTYVQKKYVDDKYIVSGTTNYISKFTGSNSIGNSQIYDNGTNLGVGNTSPSYKLDVSGTGRFTDDLNIVAVTPRLKLTDGTSTFLLSTNTSGEGIIKTEGTSKNIRFFNNSGETFRINGGGNVSIGNTNNTYKLDVSGTGRFTSDLTVQGTGNSSFAGKVGIGTTSPTTKLHVLGTTSSMPSLGAAASAAQIGGSSYGTLFSTLASGRGVIQQGRSDGIATSYDLLLQPVGGNVGIGSASPTSKLQVVGLPNYADNAAALAGGLTVGAFYHTAGLLKVVI